MFRPFLGAAALSLVLVGCDEPKSLEVISSDSEALSSSTQTDSESTDIGAEHDKFDTMLLAFVNAPDTTLSVLDHDVGLDVRAAERIVRHRDGRDGDWGTSDDNPVDSIGELMSIDFVGSVTVDRLEDWIDYLGQDGELVEGVAFTDDEATFAVSLANTADADWLDLDLDIDVRAVDHIIDARPISNLQVLSQVPYVGPATLERLRDATHK